MDGGPFPYFSSVRTYCATSCKSRADMRHRGITGFRRSPSLSIPCEIARSKRCCVHAGFSLPNVRCRRSALIASSEILIPPAPSGPWHEAHEERKGRLAAVICFPSISRPVRKIRSPFAMLVGVFAGAGGGAFFELVECALQAATAAASASINMPVRMLALYPTVG